MPVRPKTVTAGDGPPSPQRIQDWRTTTSATQHRALNVADVVRALCRSFSFSNTKLPEEFFPAHLSVALVDLVFRFGLGRGQQQPPPIAERYCRRFGLARVRTDSLALPRRGEQETLGTLVRRYHGCGVDGMANEVFRNLCRFPGTEVPRAAYVVRIANELRRIGINLLQDVQVRRLRQIDEALRSLSGVDEHFLRMLLMYTGADDRVVGDGHVRSFVARTINRHTVSAAEAVDLVRRSAYELALSPRYLDYHIWRGSQEAPKSVGSKEPTSTVERPNVDLERSLALQTEDGLSV